MSFKEWFKNSEYKDKEPLLIEDLDCYACDLTSLNGIEKFKNLKYLDCSSNNLTSLKGIESLVKLKILSCSYNKIISLKEIIYLPCLIDLFSHGNNLEHTYCYLSFNHYQNCLLLSEYQQYLKRFYRKERIKNFKL